MVLTRSQTNEQDTFHDATTTQSATENGTSSSTEVQQNVISNHQNHVSVLKLPQFWTSCPHAWFIQIDMQFQMHNIGDDNLKYQYVITSLSQDVILKILDVVQNPPLNAKYEFIKRILCERFSLGDEARFEEIISNCQLDGRKPSDLFRELTALAGPLSFVTPELIFKLWQRKLPQHIQIHLTSSGLKSIDEKVTLADKIYQMCSPSVSIVNSTESVPNNAMQNFTQMTTTLNESINTLNLNIAEMKNKNFNNPHDNNLSRNSSRSFQRRRNFSENTCWYHTRFGNRALKCIEPCKFFNNFQTQSLN